MSFSHFDFEYIDVHCHFFPIEIFKAIWDFFEQKDHRGTVRGWNIFYKSTPEELVKILEDHNVKAFTTFNYAHKEGIADFINEWTRKFVENHKNAIPFGCIWPDDKDKVEYIKKIFDNYNFKGLKIQPLVQNFYPYDERLIDVYDLIVDKGKWYTVHAGTAPYKNPYVGYKHFVKLMEKYPDMNVIVAHLGAFEYKKFFNLLDKYENLYLDTAMIYIPDNIFPERTVKRPKPDMLISYQDRILFGSDFPNIPYEYERSTKGLFELNMPYEFYKKIFYENAKRIFKLY
jgi:predicted TIM-barrel fold metal-dependent hydrolase